MHTAHLAQLDAIRAIVARVFYIPEAGLHAGTSLIEDLDADSLDLFECLDAFEDELGLRVPPEHLRADLTLATLAALAAQTLETPQTPQTANIKLSANGQSASTHCISQRKPASAPM